MQRVIDYSRTLKDGELKRILSAYTDGEIADNEYVAAHFPPRPRDSHKGTFGTACIIAGSEQYLGASALSVGSALRSGCGYIYAVVPQTFKHALAARYPQAIYCDKPLLKADAIAVGMGLCCNERTYAQVCTLLENYKGKLIIDADGLNSLARYGVKVLKNTGAEVLITPHIGEMARLCNLTVEKVQSDPVKVAEDFAEEYGVTVHLKSAVSVTCAAGREGANKTIINVRGTSALAKAGSGDILSGLICGNAARGLSLSDSAVCSQYLLGVSAEICSESMTDYAVTADEIIKNIPFALKRLTDGEGKC